MHFLIYFHSNAQFAKVAANHFLNESDTLEGLFEISGGEFVFPLETESKANKWIKTLRIALLILLCAYFSKGVDKKKRVEWMHAQRFIFQTIRETARRRRRMRPELEPE